MTPDENPIEHVTGDSSRRSFLKKGGLVTGGLALGLGSSGLAAAQDDQQTYKAIMYRENFFPGLKFRVLSGPIDWTPPLGLTLFQNYSTRIIRYLPGQTVQGQAGQNVTGQNQTDGNQTQTGGNQTDGGLLGGDQTARQVPQSPVLFFPTQDAQVQQGQVYAFGQSATPVEVTNEDLVTVQFSPVQGAGAGAGGNATGGNQSG